ncbi:LysR substrate-binding domain-containing protein [Paraburkholderia sp. BL17N1]|uniref:LysR substrate-binding domain-containing protein n=1 Tax=Paraburkholderia sp. BL17N1 TaxID=1938798 RepID=UPI000EB0CA38|nr:LysR substrate-binding domain-containing protein [Paraburkholderia sp. BL17N1]RKR31230.1 LysR family glycine cleavage system transcriptional activator [Paraburkholderia sp. BL17N1]
MHKLRNLAGPLRVFDAVCREGGIIKAANALHVTPGAVSQQIKSLESNLGIVLLRRQGREVELTELGEALGLRVADAFDRMEKGIRDVCASPSARQLHLKVTPSLAIRWLLPRLPSFYAQCSDVDLVIQSSSTPGDWGLDQADFVVRHGMGDWEGMLAVHLFDDALTPVCDPETAKQLRNPEDLGNFKLLHSLMRADAWDTWFRSLGIDHRPPTTNLSLANAVTSYEAAADGLGVAIAQLSYVEGDLKTGRLVAPFDHVARLSSGYYLVSDLSRVETPPVKAFRKWVSSLK